MIHQVTVERGTEGLSITLPAEIVQTLKLREGDPLHVVETDSGVLLTPFDPEFQAAMEVYLWGSGKYANVLRELAKSDTHTDTGQEG